MFYSKVANKKYLIRLLPSEKLVASIIKFCEEKDIENAYFTAIGSIDNPTLAHYTVKNKKFKEVKLSGTYELTSLIGNVARLEKKPLVHAHTSLSDINMQGFGGHLVEAKTSAAIEIFLDILDSNLEKKFDKETGLKVWQLTEEIRDK